ncbi:MAG: lipid-A-disaccharide synthase, partial [Candidatus Eisenbacteria bacterium]
MPGPRPSRARGKADGGHRDGGKFHAGGGPCGRTRALRGPGRTLQPRRPGVPPPSQSAAIHRGAPARPDRAPRHRRGRDPGSHDPRPGSGALAHEVAGNRGARRGGPGADAAHRHRERATHVRERLRGEPDREPRLPRENTQDSLLRDERVPLDRLPEPERRGVHARALRLRGSHGPSQADPAAPDPGRDTRPPRVGAHPFPGALARAGGLLGGGRSRAGGASGRGGSAGAGAAKSPAGPAGLKFPFLIVSAGEPSGDRLGAELLEGLRARGISFEAAGIGGPKLRAAGLTTVVPMESVAVMGFASILGRLPEIRRARGEIVRLLEAHPEAIFLPIDSPGLHLGLARTARSLGRRVVYYVCPQIWAWGGGRIRRLKQDVDLTLLLFRFESELLAKEGVPARWVGHPAGALRPDPSRRAELRKALGIGPGERLVSLLPGSRLEEVRRHLVPMLDGAARVAAHSGARVRVAVSDAGPVDEAIRDPDVRRAWSALLPIHWREDAKDLLRAADAAVVASGTATLETAALQVPQVIVYRTGWLNYEIARRLVRVPSIG